VFIHWGVYSVPAYAAVGLKQEVNQQLGAWYQYNMRELNSPVWKWHLDNYGAGFTYADFASQFNPNLWDPHQWADLFYNAGAKYIVLTSKHCDGYALWGSPQKPNWNAVDVGPERDLVKDLLEAVRARGIEPGLYYCNYEWFNSLLLGPTPHDYIDQILLPMYKDVISRYKPSVVWGDYAINHPSSWWNTTELLAWIYNESPVKDNVVVDDRWGSETSGTHGGFWTVEYGSGVVSLTHKWEANRGIGWSFGYNRMENNSIYATAKELVLILVDSVAFNGNLLLDIGPSADGRIDNLLAERLLQIGSWLKVNGECIYSTRPWRVQKEGNGTWYTQNASLFSTYAIVSQWPANGKLVLQSAVPSPNTLVTVLGYNKSLEYHYDTSGLAITVPEFPPVQEEVFAFKMTFVK